MGVLVLRGALVLILELLLFATGVLLTGGLFTGGVGGVSQLPAIKPRATIAKTTFFICVRINYPHNTSLEDKPQLT